MPPPPKNPKKDKAPPVAPPVDPARYAQPGDVVYYYPHGERDEQPHSAIVTRVGIGGYLTLNVAAPDLHNFGLVDAALPMGDPRLKQGTDFAYGGWEHKPETILLRRAMINSGYMRWDPKAEKYVAEETHIWNTELQTYATNTPMKEERPATGQQQQTATGQQQQPKPS